MTVNYQASRQVSGRNSTLSLKSPNSDDILEIARCIEEIMNELFRMLSSTPRTKTHHVHGLENAKDDFRSLCESILGLFRGFYSLGKDFATLLTATRGRYRNTEIIDFANSLLPKLAESLNVIKDSQGECEHFVKTLVSEKPTPQSRSSKSVHTSETLVAQVQDIQDILSRQDAFWRISYDATEQVLQRGRKIDLEDVETHAGAWSNYLTTIPSANSTIHEALDAISVAPDPRPQAYRSSSAEFFTSRRFSDYLPSKHYTRQNILPTNGAPPSRALKFANASVITRQRSQPTDNRAAQVKVDVESWDRTEPSTREHDLRRLRPTCDSERMQVDAARESVESGALPSDTSGTFIHITTSDEPSLQAHLLRSEETPSSYDSLSGAAHSKVLRTDGSSSTTSDVIEKMTSGGKEICHDIGKAFTHWKEGTLKTYRKSITRNGEGLRFGHGVFQRKHPKAERPRSHNILGGSKSIPPINVTPPSDTSRPSSRATTGNLSRSTSSVSWRSERTMSTNRKSSVNQERGGTFPKRTQSGRRSHRPKDKGSSAASF